MAKLFEELSPLLLGNGGPIILVQVGIQYVYVIILEEDDQ